MVGAALDVLLIDATHRGRAGDSDAEITDFIALRRRVRRSLSSERRMPCCPRSVYLDGGDRVFGRHRPPLVAQGPLTLDAGWALHARRRR
jgi:hypothetical protein